MGTLGSKLCEEEDKPFKKNNHKKNANFSKFDSFQNIIDLKSKKDFQLKWENTHSPNSKSIRDIWHLSMGDQDIIEVYTIDKYPIGSGHYGTVRRAMLKVDQSKIYSVKTIIKKSLKGDLNMLVNELEIMRFVDHPNIIQFYEIYGDEFFYHIVMEYGHGEDLLSYVEKNGPLSEKKN